MNAELAALRNRYRAAIMEAEDIKRQCAAGLITEAERDALIDAAFHRAFPARDDEFFAP